METQKIVNTPYPKDIEIGIDEISVTYVQNADTSDDSEHYQRLKLTSVPVVGDELPYYVNIEIPNFDDNTPGHWSLDLDESLTPILEDFKERLSMQKPTKENKEKK